MGALALGNRALECALAMQRTVRDYDRGRDDAEKVLLCVGLGCGRLLRIGDHDVFGAAGALAGPLGFQALPEAPPGADAAYRVTYQL